MNCDHTLRSLQKRILAIVICLSSIFFALIVRLFFVQIINSSWLQAKASSQWTRDLPLTAERGKILDAYGATLAQSYTTYNVYTRAREIDDPVATATTLASILNLKFESVHSKASDRSVSEMLIKMQVEEDVAQKIIDKNLKGVYLSQNNKRYYPYGDMLTQVLGFTTIDNIGQAGIEAYYNDYLKGTDGYSLVQADITGSKLDNTLSYYVPAIAGCDITLTIDAKLQLALEEIMALLMEEQKAKSATALLLNANTGEILAMSTKPSFDLNDVPRDNPALLMETVRNKAVVDVYEPGSTFKILTMCSALEEGVVSLDSSFYCGGSTTVDGERIRCWKSIGHGSQKLGEGLANSCNCVFVDLALRLGKDKFYEYFQKFGLGQKTGIEISGESAGIIMSKDTAKRVDLARMGFGQAIAVTALQQITAVSACVNGGTLYEPSIVKSIVGPDGTSVFQNAPIKVRDVISSDTSAKINDMLESTVSKTGKYTFVSGYEIGGKTGTTQKYENGAIARGKYISSFVGTYPASNPEYVFLLTVDEPGTGAYYGSVVASPYAKQFFSKIFEIYSIAPDDPELAKLEPTEIVMPSLVGEPLAKAVATLAGMGIDYEIDGTGLTVKDQLPPAGATIYSNETIVIVT